MAAEIAPGEAPTAAPPPAGYPVQVTFDRDQKVGRKWGIPIVGWALRWLVLLPHYFVLAFLGILVAISIPFSWIPVLLTGRQAGLLITLYFATWRYSTRVLAWGLFLAGPYPPIVPGEPVYPVDIVFDREGRTINRLWGIPFLGYWLRSLLIFPHALLLAVVYLLLVPVSFVIWIPILLTGRMPGFGYVLYGGLLRLSARITLWTLLMPVPYPPLSL